MLEELPVYVKLKNSYNPAHYPANKKISAEEWNALWMSVMYQGNHQEDVLASILNVTLPEHIVAINTVETKAIQAILNSEQALGIVNEAHEMSSQALDIANEANQTANEALADINLKQNIIDEELNTSDKTIVGAINEVKNSSVAVSDIINNLNSIEINKPLSANMGNTLREIIQGQEFGRSYNTIKDLVDALNIEGPDTFKVPFLFLIVDLDVPDFWVAEVMETSVPYEYTTDAALIAAVKNSPLQIGYYKISISETAKVDLTNYVQKGFTIAGLNLEEDITKAALQTALDFNTLVTKTGNAEFPIDADLTGSGSNRFLVRNKIGTIVGVNEYYHHDDIRWMYGKSSTSKIRPYLSRSIFDVNEANVNLSTSVVPYFASGHIGTTETPTNENHYTRKGYVDNLVANIPMIPEAPVDGKSYARKDADWVTLNSLINNDTENPRSIFLDTPFVNKPMMLSALKEPEQTDDGAALFIEPESIKSYILSTTNNGSIETIGLGNKTYQITDGSDTEILKTYKYTLDIEPETVIRKMDLDNAIQQAIEDVLLGEV